MATKRSLRLVRTRSITVEAHAQADHAVRVALAYRSQLPAGERLVGRRVLEMGGGPWAGSALVLAAWGNTVTTVDPGLLEWDDEVHAPFCAALLQRLAMERVPFDHHAIRAAIDARSFAPTLHTVAADVERLDALPAGEFDMVCSHAVLGRVQQVPLTLYQLARVTAPGGIAVHSVDFRDQRDLLQPLEFLTCDADVFWHDAARRPGQRGNRWRHTHLMAALAESGFALMRFESAARASGDEIARVRPHLHADFAGLTDAELTVLSGSLVGRRLPTAPAIPHTPGRGLVPPAMQRAPVRHTTRRFVVYGADEGCREALEQLSWLGLSARVVAVCDGDTRTHGTLVAGHVVRDLDHLTPAAYDCVVVASRRRRASIEQRLASHGLVEDLSVKRLGLLGGWAAA